MRCFTLGRLHLQLMAFRHFFPIRKDSTGSYVLGATFYWDAR